MRRVTLIPAVVLLAIAAVVLLVAADRVDAAKRSCDLGYPYAEVDWPTYEPACSFSILATGKAKTKRISTTTEPDFISSWAVADRSRDGAFSFVAIGGDSYCRDYGRHGDLFVKEAYCADRPGFFITVRSTGGPQWVTFLYSEI